MRQLPFTLIYSGRLVSNGNAAEKHRLREHFSPQLERVWNQNQRQAARNALGEGPELTQWDSEQGECKGPHRFIPISDEFHLVELDIILLRPGPLGNIVRGGGDIDNRLKTLLDSLQVPDENQANTISAAGGSVYYCLLLNDKLVKRISVDTAQRLDVPDTSNEVMLILNVLVTRDPTVRPIS